MYTFLKNKNPGQDQIPDRSRFRRTMAATSCLSVETLCSSCSEKSLSKWLCSSTNSLSPSRSDSSWKARTLTSCMMCKQECYIHGQDSVCSSVIYQTFLQIAITSAPILRTIFLMFKVNNSFGQTLNSFHNNNTCRSFTVLQLSCIYWKHKLNNYSADVIF